MGRKGAGNKINVYRPTTTTSSYASVDLSPFVKENTLSNLPLLSITRYSSVIVGYVWMGGKN